MPTAPAADGTPGLVQRLQDSPQRLADSIRAAALWLATVDGPLDPREFHEVGLALTHEPEGVPLQDIAAAFAADPLPADLPRLFRFLRGQRSPKRTESLLDLFIRVAAADGRLSQVERHALVFLADLLAAPASLLRERFEAVLGLEFEPPADLADPAFFEAAEVAARARALRAKARADDAALAKRAEDERREACLVLGVKPDATPIAAKAAWRRLSRQFHPDRQPQGDPAALAAAAARFDAVQKAWKRLQEDEPDA
jgi:tellurite resistance protein